MGHSYWDCVFGACDNWSKTNSHRTKGRIDGYITQVSDGGADRGYL